MDHYRPDLGEGGGGSLHPPDHLPGHSASHRQWLWEPYAHGLREAPGMIMSPGLRKLMLTAHVTASIGWFGAVAAFLALALAGLFSQDPELMRASYLVMRVITWDVIVPLALASLL